MTERANGRPTLYNEALGKAIAENIRNGCTVENAAGVNGISRATCFEWQQRGRRGEEPYKSFLDLVNCAREDCERDMVELIKKSSYEKAGTFNERAAQWWLTHARKSDWGETKRVELTGKDGGPVQSIDITKMSDDELKAKLIELQKRIGESLETG